MGAKNHAVIMPDGEAIVAFARKRYSYQKWLANKNLALNSIIGAAFGGKSSDLTLC